LNEAVFLAIVYLPGELVWYTDYSTYHTEILFENQNTFRAHSVDIFCAIAGLANEYSHRVFFKEAFFSRLFCGKALSWNARVLGVAGFAALYQNT